MPSLAHLVELYGVGPVPAETGDAVIRVRVQKKNGQGSIEIELKRYEQGYLGPQGEFYPDMPAADRLTEIYGGD